MTYPQRRETQHEHLTPSLMCILHSHDPEEALVVHGPGLGHLGEVGQPRHWLCHGLMANSSYIPDLGSLPHPHGLEHAPVV